MTRKIPQELEYHAIGPASTLVETCVSPDGFLDLRPPGRDAQRIRLSNRCRNVDVAVIMQSGLTTVFDLSDPERLLALAVQVRDGIDVLVYGDGQPLLLEQTGRATPVSNPAELMRGRYLRCLSQLNPPTVGFRFLLNASNRPLFAPELLVHVHDTRDINRLEVWFDALDGRYRRSIFIAQSPESQRLLRQATVDVFPLRFPGAKSSRARSKEGASVNGTQSKPAVEPSPVPAPIFPPRPKTTQVEAARLLVLLGSLPVDEEGRWREIESNLEMLDSQRTFLLVGAYPELIAQRTKSWPRYKMREIFGAMPGSRLQLLFDAYFLDQCLALAEDHPDRAELLEYLKEHELERLLALRIDSLKADLATARGLLRIGPEAGPKDIRQIWRLLLSWINVDFGRSDERGIHQKKDEIAKWLQIARDELSKHQTGSARPRRGN